MQDFKYFAFISYSSHDTLWGRRLQRKLEHYRLPATLCSEHNLPRNPIKPVFFAPTDIQPGGLTVEIQERLRASRNLIIICSPSSAQSEWVGKEIEFFHNLGRTDNIHFFIVEGIPHSGNPDTECFNPIVEQLKLPEILGANIHEKIYRRPWLNHERAYVQLVSKLLGVEFDTIWRRHKRLLKNKISVLILTGTAILMAMFGIRAVNQPFDARVSLKEVSYHNDELPPLKDAVITLILEDEIKNDTIYSVNSWASFNNIPHHYLNKKVRITSYCKDFKEIDTVVIMKKEIVLNIKRDTSIYGDVHFYIWNPKDEKYLTNVILNVDNYETTSDDRGFVKLFIPIEKQKRVYKIKASFLLGDEQIFMPCGEKDVIMVMPK